MICQSCQQNPATVHLTEIVQQHKKETHLCEGCAKSRGVPFKAPFSVKEFLNNLASAKSALEGALDEPGGDEQDGDEPEVLGLGGQVEAPSTASSSSTSPSAAASSGGSSSQEEESPLEVGPCGGCGATFADFRKGGRLGCPECYEHLEAGLSPLLERIHGAVRHVGRIPRRLGEALKRAHELEACRTQLAEAVQREAYERAAELRDQIRALEALDAGSGSTS